MYRVSVIMPVFNNEKTLEKAIETILNQTMPGIELILINDGSTDRSAQICDAYAKKEPLLVEVIHQKHQGLTTALNTGLLNSTGNYLYFASPEDQFNANLLASNIRLAEEKDADVVVFGFQSEKDDYSQEIEAHLPRIPLITSQYEFRNHFRNYYHFYAFELFNKLYKREYLLKNRLSFQRYSSLGYQFFNLKLYQNLGSVAFNRGVYLKRGSSAKENSKTIANHVDLHRIFIQELEKLFQYWGYETEYQDLIAEELYLLIYNELKKITDKSSSLTNIEQIKHIETIINHEELKNYLKLFTLLQDKTAINRILLNQLQKGNVKASIDLFTRKSDSQRMTGSFKRIMRKILD